MTLEALSLFILYLLYIPSLRAQFKEAIERLLGPNGKASFTPTYC